MSRHRRQSTKRKHNEEVSDPSEGLAEPDCTVSIARFTAWLQKLAPRGNISYSARISTLGLAGDENEIRKVILGHVWEVTWFT